MREGARSHHHRDILIQHVLWRVNCALIFEVLDFLERDSRSFKGASHCYACPLADLGGRVIAMGSMEALSAE